MGLAGGLNLYQYAPSPLNWVDPLGLSKCSPDSHKGVKYASAYLKKQGIPRKFRKQTLEFLEIDFLILFWDF